MSIYLDYNSSAPIEQRVLEYMFEVYRNIYGNADSRTHTFGDNARKVVEDAREKVASILSVKKEEVFFTSGATESNNIAIQGLRRYGIKSGKTHIITTAIEHKAVLETVKSMLEFGFDIDIVKPDQTGRVSLDKIKNLIRSNTLLVSVMHVNNETGIIQPVDKIGEFLFNQNILFHIDATQSFGKLVEELKRIPCDMLSMSAHKIGGPQGVGALILKKRNYKLPPVENILYGGQQERGIRPGTIPVALVAGLGKACEIAEKEYRNNMNSCTEIKKSLEDILSASKIKYKFNGDPEYCIKSTMNICIHGVSSEALMLATRDYCSVSNGSACNSFSYKPSYVLEAMGIPVEDIENSIRISWGPNEDKEIVRESFSNMIEVAKSLAF